MLIDTHAHLDDPAFDVDRDEVVARARAAGVTNIVAVATDAASSARGLELSARYAGVYPTVGIHPNHAAQAAIGDWEQIERLARRPGVVALGETGLDRHWNTTPWEVQVDYFQRHLRLSRVTGLPVVIHTRDCQDEMLVMLWAEAAAGALRGVMHSFTGDAEAAVECVALGLYISFAGMVTYKKSEALRQVAAAVRIDRLLVETDSPYLAPQPVRGQRNEPAHVIYTARLLAELRGATLDEFAEQTTANARRLFRLPAP
jgi:TatD DNase family protein